ncbi:MAG: precorrin-8X methylmutase [bacterium]
MDAILLLGHGSRLSETNKTLLQMAQMVKEIGKIPLVEIAFLQFQRPDFFDAVKTCISKNAKKIIVHPYFLYQGRHFEEDITEMITEAKKRYNEIEFILTEPLGVHENIARLVLERTKKNIREVKILKSDEIEEKSIEIIGEELGETNFRAPELSIVKRVIHASADFDFAKNLRFHPEAVEAGIRAIKAGKDILVDVRMVEAGINKRLLQNWHGRVICKIQNFASQHSSNSKSKIQTPEDKTKAEMGIEMALQKNNNIGIIAIGNAPTALYRAMKLIHAGIYTPGLVIGVPVGFVKAVESKEVLLHMKYPFITSVGRKGGSPVAVAIVNSLLKIAEGNTVTVPVIQTLDIRHKTIDSIYAGN